MTFRMRRWGLALVVTLGASCGSSGSSVGCDDATGYIVDTCATDDDADEVRSWCLSLVCTDAQRRATVECILDATCADEMYSAALACATDAGCAAPTSVRFPGR